MHSRNVYCIRKHAANRLLIAANTAIQSQNGPGWISGQVFQRAHQCDLLHPAKYLSKYTTRSPVGRGWHCKPSLGRNAKGFNLTHLSSTENILKNYTLRLSLQRFSKHSKKFWKGNISRKIWDHIFRTRSSQRHFRIPPGSTWELRSFGSLRSV